jgi:hypothetical protein
MDAACSWNEWRNGRGSGRGRAATSRRGSAERGCPQVSEGLGPSRQRAGGGTSARPTEAPRSRGAPTLPVGVSDRTNTAILAASAECAACVTRRPAGPGWGRTWPRQLSAPVPSPQIAVCVRARVNIYSRARACVCACARACKSIFNAPTLRWGLTWLAVARTAASAFSLYGAGETKSAKTDEPVSSTTVMACATATADRSCRRAPTQDAAGGASRMPCPTSTRVH